MRDIVDAVAGEPGSKSDITLFREYRSRFHLQQRFKGYLADRGEDLIETPLIKSRNRELTIEQKEENKKFSVRLIFAEHRIREAARCALCQGNFGGNNSSRNLPPCCSDCRSVKIFRVVQERLRLNPQKYEQVILTICVQVSELSADITRKNTSDVIRLKLTHITRHLCFVMINKYLQA